MTAARNAAVPAAFTREYGCHRRCQVEFDLAAVHVRFTLGQMLARADHAHEQAHLVDPQRAFRAFPDTLVRAGVAA